MKKWFQVRRNCNILGRNTACHVTLERGKTKSRGYKILRLTGKLGFKITDDTRGELIAEVSLNLGSLNTKIFWVIKYYK